MNEYEALARELMQSVDQHRKAPPHEEIGAAVRGEMAVLRLLMRETKPMTAGELSKQLRMTTPRIAAVLSSLEKKGMIHRKTDAGDKRRIQVTLTEQGSTFCLQKKEQVISKITLLLSQLGSEDAGHFVRIMKRIQEFTCPPSAGMTDNKKNKEEVSADEQ